MLLDEQLFEDNNKELTYDEKVEYIKNYPTYQSRHDKYFTRPCKVWDLNLTPHQVDTWDNYIASGELGVFWQENSELADKIYQEGRMGGHLILDDEEAVSNDWSEFSSFDDVFQACLDEYSYYDDDPVEEWEYSQARETAENKVDNTYNKVKSFDERVDKLIELLKKSLDEFSANKGEEISEEVDNCSIDVDSDYKLSEHSWDIFDAPDNSKILDTISGKVGYLYKTYQRDNYAYAQVKFGDTIRKVRFFADKNSINDINRYKLIVEEKINERKNEKNETLGDYDSTLDKAVQKELDSIFASPEKSFPYQMLDRLKSDCKYILGAVKDESEDYKVPLDIINKFLWFHDIDKQVALMRGIYDRLEEKPEWISLEDIDGFEKDLKEVVRENGQVSEDFAIRERTADELRHMIDYYTKAIEEYKKANDLEDAEWCEKQLEWAKHELSKKGNMEENLNENKPRKLTYDKLYDMLEDAGYHLFASSEYNNALALAKKEEASLQAAKDICDKNEIEYDVNFYKPTGRFHMTIFLPDGMLEEELSRNGVIDLAKKHNVDLKFTDETKSGSFLVNGDPKDMSEFFDDYKKSYIESETKKEEVKNESLNEELSETTLKNTALKNILSALIQDELQAIDGYNSAIVTFESEGASQFTDVFRDIITEENKHIGQLQAALGEIDPQDVSDIEAGQSEGEEQIQTELSPEGITEVEVTEKSE